MKITIARKGQLFLISSFAALIFAGMLLLLLPGIMKDGREISLIDALFMSCSATCLNGLATVPLTEFTFAGQLILLILIQIGTIGIMSLSAMVLMMIGKGLSFSETLLISNLNDRFTLRGAESLTKTIVNYTFVSEAIGALLLLPGFLLSGKGYGFFESCWYSIYFSIGSFCNAGLGPLANSMADVNRYCQTVCMLLMISGGLGVYAVYDVRQVFLKRVQHLTLHTKIVLRCAGILIFSGAAMLWILSHTGNGSDLGIFESFFLSVSGRTTGYSTIDPGKLSSACQILIIALMLIGGAPGSAAGGMKTTTIAVIFAALRASFRGDNSVIISKRTIELRVVLRAFTVMFLFILLTWAGAVLLKSFSSISSSSCFFEAASALSATGLSTGETTMMWNPVCKLFLIFFMFIGRLGPVTILLFFVGKEKKESLRYPEERVIVG